MSIKLGGIAPNFQADSSVGKIIDFYNHLGNSWGILFSHPTDFTPVCPTELGMTARLQSEFDNRNTNWNKMILLSLLVCGLAVSCKKAENKENQSKNSFKVMTKEQQDKLTGEAVLKDFIEGNKRFQNEIVTMRDHTKHSRKLVTGRFPKAAVISCSDNRIPVEDIFDQGLGDIFEGRVAGNFVDEDLLGSIELACVVAGAKLVIVMGHQHCGAVKGAIDNVKLGNITATLYKIRPAVNISLSYTGMKNSKNNEFVKFVSENNVRIALNDIRKKSPILKEMEDNGKIKIVGTLYSPSDGTLQLVK